MELYGSSGPPHSEHFADGAKRNEPVAKYGERRSQRKGPSVTTSLATHPHTDPNSPMVDYPGYLVVPFPGNAKVLILQMISKREKVLLIT